MKKDNIENIYFENDLYASIFDVNNISEGLDFLTSDDSYIQVGTWSYDKGKSLLNLIIIIFLKDLHLEHKKLFMF